MNILKLELRNLRKSSIIAILSISAAIYAMLAFFPSMQTESMQALAGAKLEGIDPALLAALGLSEMTDFSVITNYFGYVLQYIALAIMVLMVQQAVGLFIKEESDGTIEFLCAKPISRSDIFLQKLMAHLTVLIAMIFTCAVVTVIGYIAYSDYSLGEALKENIIFYIAILFIGLIYSSIGILISTIIKSGKGISGMTIALVFGTFIIGIMSQINKELDFLIWLSPMDWIKVNKLMDVGIKPDEWIIGSIVILSCTFTAWLRYRKKDLLI